MQISNRVNLGQNEGAHGRVSELSRGALRRRQATETNTEERTISVISSSKKGVLMSLSRTATRAEAGRFSFGVRCFVPSQHHAHHVKRETHGRAEIGLASALPFSSRVEWEKRCLRDHK